MQNLRILASSLLLLVACGTAQDRPGLTERRSTLQVVESDQEDLDLRMTPIVRAVQKAADSVVSVYINHATARTGNRPLTEGQGSGVVLDAAGLVITNWHVVAPVANDITGAAGYSVQARFRDGRTFDARVLSTSPEYDLALLQLRLAKEDTVKPIEIGRSADLMIGETVIAIGNPQGHANTVTSGVLSATGRSIRVRSPDAREFTTREYSGLLQTDAAINQGNSGGALLDITGKLIGINNAMAMGAENIGFAIPVDTVREVFETELLSSDRFITYAWLGLEVEDDGKALVVQSVQPTGPAAEAGIAVGDQLVGIGDAEVASRLDYLRRMLGARAGQPLPIRLRREGRELRVNPKPLEYVQGEILSLLGLQVEEVSTRGSREDVEVLNRATRVFYTGYFGRVTRLPAVLRVTAVEKDGDGGAFAPGDLLIGVTLRDGRETPIPSAGAFAEYVRGQQGQPVRVVVLRGEDDLVGTIDVRRVGRQR